MGGSENGSQSKKLKVSYLFYLSGKGHGSMKSIR